MEFNSNTIFIWRLAMTAFPALRYPSPTSPFEGTQTGSIVNTSIVFRVKSQLSVSEAYYFIGSKHSNAGKPNIFRYDLTDIDMKTINQSKKFIKQCNFTYDGEFFDNIFFVPLKHQRI
jgi:hypothetical protein